MMFQRLSLQGRRLFSDAVRYKFQPQLFLIPQASKTALISFSSKPSAKPIGKIIDVPEDEASFKLIKVENSNFEPNQDFLDILHKLINDEVHNDFTYKTEAGPAVNSYMPIYDFRGRLQYGRAPEIDNVIGYVRVDDVGEIVPHSYERNPAYRLNNDVDGVIKLSDFLAEEIVKVIE